MKFISRFTILILNYVVSSALTSNAQLSSWALTKAGIKIIKCELHIFDENIRGIIATEDMGMNDVFLEVPLRSCITETTAFDIGESVQDDWQLNLAFKLLDEKNKGKSSSWFPYIDHLPQAAEFLKILPIYWKVNQHDLKLKGVLDDEMEVFFNAEVDKIKIWRNYAWLEARRLNRVTYTKRNDLEWALNCVQTRAIDLILENGDTLHLMVPIADMFNHNEYARGMHCLVFVHNIICTCCNYNFKLYIGQFAFKRNKSNQEPVFNLQFDKSIISNNADGSNDDMILSLFYTDDYSVLKGQQMFLNYGPESAIHSLSKYLHIITQ